MVNMGHILIKNLNKSYLNRRRTPRNAKNKKSQFGDLHQVFVDINLEFCHGEMVCILGPSGCGKSSLLRIIAGFDKAYSGELLIDGQKVIGPSPDHIFVFQHSSLLPWMTVWQNVGLGLRHLKDIKLKEEKIQENIEMVELTGFEHYYPHQLSGGMQRRAELARALAVDPDVLFMDEPFTGLDFLTHLRIREEVVNMHEFLGKTILFVTHDIDDALVMGDRIVILGDHPSKVKMSRKLHFPRPRDFIREPGLRELRDEIFFMLGVSYAV
jgi:ABC-type nitrate/sulfonate/bicarbonate transport system ATPase subunit